MRIKLQTPIYYLSVIIVLILTACNNEASKEGYDTNDSLVGPPAPPDRDDQDQHEKTEAEYYIEREKLAPPEVTQKLDSLRDYISDNKLTFTVGYTAVAERHIKILTGERQLSETENQNLKNKFLREKVELEKAVKADPYITRNGVTLSPKMSKLDLREHGLVTSIKDQGSAGACWAFGAMAAFESSYDYRNKVAINTSEQYIINCSGAGSAANGGLAFMVFDWMVRQLKNVDDETTTPYLATDKSCSPNSPKTKYFSLEWDFVDPGQDPGKIPTVDQIKDAMCKYGAISASVYVSSAFQYYSGEIFKEPGPFSGTNHAISLIGWDDSKNAWILKNSWGPGWGISCNFPGEGGYMWIDYGTNNIGRRAAWVKAKPL